MSEARTCSQCGTPLNNDAPEGFCPTCMLEGALRLGGVDERVSSVEGRRFGDYELLDEIARGGMGIVYRARQISLNRIVAVKFILIGHFADKSMVRRFKAEAAAAAKLRHSNIVAIHEIGEEAGQHFFSMDYVEGANLADFMRHQPVSTRQAAQLLKTISEALHYAHEQGIVHRDLKPSNILIDGLLEPRITDFGLAKDLKVDSDLTLTGQMLGSPNYISPEQASGKIAVGVPSDIYSLGAILYHLLTARPPFAGETLTDTLNQVATGEAVSPRLLNPSVPRDLETLCLKCLEKEPGSRYPSAQELAEELNRFLDDEPIHARPIAAPARMWRWCRRKPVVAGLTAAVFVSIVLGFIGVLWQWNQSEAHRRLAEQKVEESRRNLYVADMILAQGALEAGNTGHAEELLRKYRPRRGEKDLRGWEWRYTWAQSRSDELFTLEQRIFHPVTSLALSSDARTLASGSLDETVELWDLVTKQRIRTLLQSYVVFGMAFSNDGKELIVGTGDGRVSFWNCDTWQRVTTLTNLSPVRSLKLSPDGKTLAGFGERFLTIWNLANRQEVARFDVTHDHFAPPGLAFSRDSSLLAYNKGDGTIVLWDLANAKGIELKGHERFVCSLAFSVDGSVLVSGGFDHTARVWDIASRKEIKLIDTFSGWVGCLEFSPDGEVLAVAGADQRIKLLETRTWREINTLKGHSDQVWAVVFAPDGTKIMTGSEDTKIKCWAVSPRNELDSQRLPSDVKAVFLLPGAKHLYLVHTNQTYSLGRTDPFEETERYPVRVPDFTASTLSPDGKLWAAATTNGLVKIFDHTREQFIAEAPISGGGVASPESVISRFTFSLDGQMLAGVGKDRTCRVWRIAAGRDGMPVASEISSFAISAQAVRPPKFSRSGRLLGISLEGGAAEIWNIASVTASAGNPKSRKVATLHTNRWHFADIGFSRDDSTAVTACLGGRVRVWDLKTTNQVADLGGQLSSCYSVALSPDDSRLAACGGDGTVKLWETVTFQEVANLKIHNYPLYQMAFSSDDDNLVVAGDDRVFVLRAPKGSER